MLDAISVILNIGMSISVCGCVKIAASRLVQEATDARIVVIDICMVIKRYGSAEFVVRARPKDTYDAENVLLKPEFFLQELESVTIATKEGRIVSTVVKN